jgi:hypothetical protein
LTAVAAVRVVVITAFITTRAMTNRVRLPSMRQEEPKHVRRGVIFFSWRRRAAKSKLTGASAGGQVALKSIGANRCRATRAVAWSTD